MAVAIQRPLKGSRISSFYPVKSLPPLSALDSAFQLQEYISLLIRLDVHDVDKIVSIPGKGSEGQDGSDAKTDEKDAEKDGAAGVTVDEACWVYEQLRRLAQDLSHPLITMLQQECTRSTCPEMKAGEWLYLCVAHGNDGAMEQCCAIDYILHTLDSATALLNSPRAFPSRLSVPPTSHRHFSSLARRLGRIFAHAYFHHREAFEQAEAESSLYARFLALTSKFDLVPAEFLVIPPRLTAMPDDDRRGDHVEPPRLLSAALDPRRDIGRGWSPQAPPRGEYAAGGDGRGDGRGTSPPGPAGHARNESPRKFGRSRTDTMVYSEAFIVAEELAKGDLSEVDIDREIAAERAAAASGADMPSAPSAQPAEVEEHPPAPSQHFTEEPEELVDPVRDVQEAESVPEPEPEPIHEDVPSVQVVDESAPESAPGPTAEPGEDTSAEAHPSEDVAEPVEEAAPPPGDEAKEGEGEDEEEEEEKEEEGEEEEDDDDEEDEEEDEEESDEVPAEAAPASAGEPAPVEPATPPVAEPTEEVAAEAVVPAPAPVEAAAVTADEDKEEEQKEAAPPAESASSTPDS